MDTEFGNAALLGMLECNLFVEVTFLIACNLLFSLQPSKLDLDVFIAICQVDLDARKYPNIVQWKKLVMSYSEATQQRLHFIYFKFKLLHSVTFLCPSPFLLSLHASPPPLWLPHSLPLWLPPSCHPCLTSLPPYLFPSLPPCISLSPTLPPLSDSFLHSLPLSPPPSITPSLPGSLTSS